MKMKRNALGLPVLLLALGLGRIATAAVSISDSWRTLYVATGGDDANDGSSWENAKATVASAIAAAVAGNAVVEVGEGMFRESATVQLTNAVWVVGQGANKTVLNFGASVRGVRMTNSSARLDSLCISNAVASGDGGGINISSGEVRDCRITSCKATGSYGSGGGIYISGGLVSGCEIDHCQFTAIYSFGNGVAISGGVVTNCDMHANNGGYSHADPAIASGGGAYIQGGTLVASRIHHNVKASVAGIYQNGGTIANCIVYANSGTTAGAAGLYKKKGDTYHSTFFGNKRSSDTEGDSGLKQLGGTTINCIFSGNYPAGNTLGGVKVTGGTFRTNMIDVAISYGTGIIASDALLADPENGDFHLRLGSPAINAGAPLAAWPTDCDGVVRGSSCDIGAFEYVPAGGPLSAAIVAAASVIPVGGSATWTAAVDGDDQENLSYAWYMDGNPEACGTGSSYTYTDAEVGRHTLSLAVFNGAGEVARASLAHPLAVLPLIVYVSHDGAGVWPYDTVEKATNSLKEAHAALWISNTTTADVRIASGTYRATDQILMQAPMRIVGEGPSETILDFRGLSRGFQLATRHALVESLCVSNAAFADKGGGIYLQAGTVRNCRVTHCRTTGQGGNGGGVRLEGGTLSGCEIDHCYFANLYSYGNGLSISGGVATNCDIHANNGGYSHSSYASAGGVHMTGGRLVDSRIHNNFKLSIAGLKMEGGTVENCQICNNGGTAYGCAGVHMSGGILRNSLIAGNFSSNTLAGVFISQTDTTKAANEFCTITRNVALADTKGTSGFSMANGTAVGNIIWGNGSGDTPAGGCLVQGGTFNTNLTDVAVSIGTGNIVGEPGFRNFAEGNYRLRRGSPCTDAGPALPWMATARDLDGEPRLYHGHAPDLGCYECAIPASTLLIMR